MAERERCYCGEMAFTQDGFCARHRDQSSVKNEVTVEQKLAQCRAVRDEAHRRVREADQELADLRRKVQQLTTLAMLVALGDVPIDDIGAHVERIR
jgi:alkylhydroperoxidase/carboxymuconolactone decarboxylase family protein YurZ